MPADPGTPPPHGSPCGPLHALSSEVAVIKATMVGVPEQLRGNGLAIERLRAQVGILGVAMMLLIPALTSVLVVVAGPILSRALSHALATVAP